MLREAALLLLIVASSLAACSAGVEVAEGNAGAGSTTSSSGGRSGNHPPVQTHPSWGRRRESEASISALNRPPSSSVSQLLSIGGGNGGNKGGKRPLIVSAHGREDEHTKVERPRLLPLLVRSCFLALVFSPVVALSWLAYFIPWFRINVFYRLLVSVIAACGPAFIKWGQWASVRSDFFPEELCSLLSLLHSHAPSHSYRYTERVVRRAMGGRPLSTVFDWFGQEPIASGSIAQVHKAVLHGEVVAVKVRHPRVRERIEMDFAIMRFVADALDHFPMFRWLNLGPSVKQFGATLSAQVRLDIEGQHLAAFNQNFRGFSGCNFPRPLWTTEEVLVETYEEGFLVSEFIDQSRTRSRSAKDPLSGQGAFSKFMAWSFLHPRHQYEDVAPADPELAHFIVSTGVEVYLKMLLLDNLMHADLHYGNILVHTPMMEGKRQPQLILVDAGMVAELVPEERENFIGLLHAMGDGDGVAAARCVLKFSASQSCVGNAADDFERDMVAMFAVTCRGYHTNVDVGTVLRGVLKLVRIHGVRISTSYATLVINVLCLDGLATALLPEYNIMDGSKPLMRAHHFCGRGVGNRAWLLRLVVHMASRRKNRRDRHLLTSQTSRGDHHTY